MTIWQQLAHIWVYLAALAIALEVVWISCVFVFVKRVRNRPPLPGSQEIGSTKIVLTKARKREPMSHDELRLAHRVIGDRRSLMMYAIPAAIFTMGCFYVFGSLEQLHGATPSERTFLGVIPMFTSTNLTIRLLKSAGLKKRLPKKAADDPALAGQPSTAADNTAGK